MTDTLPAGPKPASIPLVLPPSQFTDASAAFKVFPLSNPVTVDGKGYTLIGIRRFTVAQIAAITENFRANLALDPDATMALPVYVDERGDDLPRSVLDQITPDEAEDLDKVTADFLPRRFRVDTTAPEVETPPPAGGSTTAPSS